MSQTTRVNLTAQRIADAPVPAKGETFIWDSTVPSLALRVRSTGAKSWVVRYRTAGGRDGASRRVTLGSVEAVPLDAARKKAKALVGKVALGGDPVGEAEAARAAEAEAKAQAEAEEAAQAALMRLAPALDAYNADLERRGVRDRANVLSMLRRKLLGGLGDVPLVEIDRRSVMALVEQLAEDGQPGAARSLRHKAATFLNWAASRGHIAANPLAGMRKDRETRAERMQRPGRMLTEAELAAVWTACRAKGVNPAFGSYIRFLILTGQRRTETAVMRWEDLDEAREWWTIPADVAKNGTAHAVPLGPEAKAIIDAMPRFAGCPWVFSTSGEAPLAGFSKLLPRLYAAAGLAEPWTPHDLRRSFRSGLTRLRVDESLAEIMINHRPETLRAIYDREPRLKERRAAALRWERAIMSALAKAGSNVVALVDRQAHRGAA